MVNSIQNHGNSQSIMAVRTDGVKTNNPLHKICDFVADKFDINKPMSESMIKLPGGWFSTTFAGELNNKKATFNTESKLFKPGVSETKGKIDGKNIEFTVKNSFSRSRTCKGKYGEKEFDLQLENTNIFSGTRYIKGTIDGKEVSFDLKTSKLPEDSDTQDIITSVLFQNGESASVKNDEFNGTRTAAWKIHEGFKRNEEMFLTCC